MEQGPQYFQLNSELLLRSWEDVKHALVNSRNGEFIYLTRLGADALELAWNGIPLDSPVMLSGYRQFFESLIQKNYGIRTNRFVEPLPKQRMKSARCCMRGIESCVWREKESVNE